MTEEMESAIRDIDLKHVYYSHCFKIGRVMKTDKIKNKEIPFIFECQTKIFQILENIYQEHMFYYSLLNKRFGTGEKLGPGEVSIVKLKYRSRNIYINNEPVVKFKQKDERSCCFGSLTSYFNAIGDSYSEEVVSSIVK